MLEAIIERMRIVFADLPYGVDHTLRVLETARKIALREQLDAATLEVISLAAVLHDIGAPTALAAHGSIDGHLQELEGPPVARAILQDAGVAAPIIDRVCYMVGSHHTRSRVDGHDFEALWDADAIDDLENGEARHDPERCRARIREDLFTAAGREIALARIGRDSHART